MHHKRGLFSLHIPPHLFKVFVHLPYHIILCLLLHSLYKETAMLFTCHALTAHPIFHRFPPFYSFAFFPSVKRYLILPIFPIPFFFQFVFLFFINSPKSWQLKSICSQVPSFSSPQFLQFSLLAAQSPLRSCRSCGHPQWMLVRQACHYTAGQRDRYQYIATLLPLLICRGTR